MASVLQSDIDILVLRHLAAYSCTETARCLVKEKPELRTYIQMQAPMRNTRLLGGCTPATDSIHTLRCTTLVHSSLKDIISEYANAKAIVKQLTDSLVFEWQALKYDEINSQDSLMTQLRAITRLLGKLCQSKPEMVNESTCTMLDGILPMYFGHNNKTTADVEVQTTDIEEEEDEAVQYMFYNNFLSNTGFQEKIAHSINEQLSQPQKRNEEVVVKSVCSKTESEIDVFLREMLSDAGGDYTAGSSPSIESTEQTYVDVEQNLISMFNDAQSIIESTVQATQPPHKLQSAQKRPTDLMEILATPSKPEVVPPSPSIQTTGRKSGPTVSISERYIAPNGKTYSIVTKPNNGQFTQWGRLGRRPIEPKVTTGTGSANKRKAKFATPVKLTPIKAHTSSINYYKPPDSDLRAQSASPEKNRREEFTKPLETEIIDIEEPKQIAPVATTIPYTHFLKPVPKQPITVTSSSAPRITPQKQETIFTKVSASTYIGSLVRPVGPSGYRVPSPIKIIRNDIKVPSTQYRSAVSTYTSSIPQLPITILSTPSPAGPSQALQNPSINPLYSPITPVASDSENHPHSAAKSEIRVLSDCKMLVTPKEAQARETKLTPSLSQTSSSAMSPFLRKLVTSAQKAKSTISLEVQRPNKKSYSTPRKKNHVRNLQFKTPPSMSKVSSETASTSSEAVNPLKRKGVESTLPRVKSKKRLEWAQDTEIGKPVVTQSAIAQTPTQTPPTTSFSVLPLPPRREVADESNLRDVVRKIVEKTKVTASVIKEVGPTAPKLIIKNKNTVINITPPAPQPAGIASQTSNSEKEKARIVQGKQDITPPTPMPKKKRGRKSKTFIDAQAAQAEACNAVPLGKRGRGRTPRKKPAPRSPLRNILPKPSTIIESPPEMPVLKLPTTVQSVPTPALTPVSTPVVLVVPPTQHQTPSSSDSSFEIPKSTNLATPQQITFSSSLSLDKGTSFSFQKTPSSSSLHNSFDKNKPTMFLKTSSSSSLHTPLTTPFKTHISPEIPPTPRLCLSTSTNPDDQIKLIYETPFNISKFFDSPLKSGNPITPGKSSNPILIDESSSGSIFDTPDKDPNAKPLDLTSPAVKRENLYTIQHTENREPQSHHYHNKNLKIVKPTVIKAGFKVSGREKALTMSEHETVIGLLHMSEGIGSPLTTKLSNQKSSDYAATPTKDLQQLLQGANVDNFLQNFVQYKK